MNVSRRACRSIWNYLISKCYGFLCKIFKCKTVGTRIILFINRLELSESQCFLRDNNATAFGFSNFTAEFRVLVPTERDFFVRFVSRLHDNKRLCHGTVCMIMVFFFFYGVGVRLAKNRPPRVSFPCILKK